MIRITSGTLKGRKVRTPSQEVTRPLLTRIRKSLADILRPRLQGARLLDLFGGSGAIAFELISNGAAGAVVTEIDSEASSLIRNNAIDLGIDARVEVCSRDAIDAVTGYADEGREFDVIIIAPPYGLGLQQRALDALAVRNILAPSGDIVVQREDREPSPSAPGELRLIRTKTYGRTVFEFYEK